MMYDCNGQEIVSRNQQQNRHRESLVIDRASSPEGDTNSIKDFSSRKNLFRDSNPNFLVFISEKKLTDLLKFLFYSN